MQVIDLDEWEREIDKKLSRITKRERWWAIAKFIGNSLLIFLVLFLIAFCF